jgi:hypothetical protein
MWNTRGCAALCGIRVCAALCGILAAVLLVVCGFAILCSISGCAARGVRQLVADLQTRRGAALVNAIKHASDTTHTSRNSDLKIIVSLQHQRPARKNLCLGKCNLYRRQPRRRQCRIGKVAKRLCQRVEDGLADTS